MSLSRCLMIPVNWFWKRVTSCQSLVKKAKKAQNFKHMFCYRMAESYVRSSQTYFVSFLQDFEILL